MAAVRSKTTKAPTLKSQPTGTALSRLAALPSSPFEISPLIDNRRFLRRTFDPDLPLLTKVYSFPTYRGMVGENWMHWHDYHEMILPIDGIGRFKMGKWEVDFCPGDLLVVDTLRLHGVSQLSGPHRSLVVLFPAAFIVGHGAPQGDSAFLSPLRARPKGTPPLLKANHPSAPAVHEALLALHDAWTSSKPVTSRYVACKAHLLIVLHHLREAFDAGDTTDALAITREKERQDRLQRVFNLLASRLPDAVGIEEAAATAGMGATAFRKFFKHTTGQSLFDYVRDMRLSNAARMLRESDMPMADVAATVGFCDQSHLNRVFTQRHGVTPVVYRKNLQGDRLSKKI